MDHPGRRHHTNIPSFLLPQNKNKIAPNRIGCRTNSVQPKSHFLSLSLQHLPPSQSPPTPCRQMSTQPFFNFSNTNPCLCQTWKTWWPLRCVVLRSAIAPSVRPYHDVQNHLNYENLVFSQIVTLESLQFRMIWGKEKRGCLAIVQSDVWNMQWWRLPGWSARRTAWIHWFRAKIRCAVMLLGVIPTAHWISTFHWFSPALEHVFMIVGPMTN
jgi:hypothetical protein